MSTQNLNICQVSLVGNIPVIKENYKNFCKFYDKLFFFKNLLNLRNAATLEK